MKKIITLSMLTLSTFMFSQNLTPTEAKKAFKDSNIRKELGFKLSDFNYKKFLNEAKKNNVNFNDILILNKTSDKDFLKSAKFDYKRRNNNDSNFCIYCKLIPFSSISLKNYTELEPK